MDTSFLVNFAVVMKKYLLHMVHFLQAHSAWVGLPLVYVGVLLMVVFYMVGLTDHNLMLLAPLALIVVGVVGHVYHEKHAGQY